MEGLLIPINSFKSKQNQLFMKQKILNGLSILFGLLLINGGLDKFFHYMPVPEGLPEGLIKDTEALMEIGWLMPLIGAVEVIGGLGPRGDHPFSGVRGYSADAHSAGSGRFTYGGHSGSYFRMGDLRKP